MDVKSTQIPTWYHMDHYMAYDGSSCFTTPQALSLVETAEPVQVRFILRLRDQHSMWMQDGCKVYMDSYMVSYGSLHGLWWIIMFHDHLDYFQESPLGGRSNTKPGDCGTLNAHNRWFILFYDVRGPAWIEIHWKSIWLKTRSHIPKVLNPKHSMTTLHDFEGVLGRPFGLSRFHRHGSWLVCEVALRCASVSFNSFTLKKNRSPVLPPSSL
jgi:hypothetical protein